MRKIGFKENSMKIHTTKENYLTSFAALNLSTAEVNTGDWHFNGFFIGHNGRPPGPFCIAGKDLVSTNHLFAKNSVYDATKLVPTELVQENSIIYAADHYRAVGDMIYNSIIKGRVFDNAIIKGSEYKYTLDLVGWFAGEEDRVQLLSYIDIICGEIDSDKADELNIWFNNLDI